jgi:glycosyltransferase involved in cell wall biosynthesis
MLKYKKVKWIYSSWGSDVYYFEKLNIEEKIFKQILQRINFLISDCNRDYEIVKKMGFKNQFLGVLPGNGGIDFPIEQRQLLRPQHRKSIIIKAYNDNIGRGMEILKSFDESLIRLLKGFDIILFGANQEIIDYVENNPQFETLKFIIYSKERSIRNKDLLQLMNNGYLYIANSLSDGMPNALLEAMGMGCFPIQSNPGNVMCEVIKNGENGLLINNPLDVLEINQKILLALKNRDMIENSFQTSVSKIRSKGNRTELRKIIVDIYEEVFLLQFNQ